MDTQNSESLIALDPDTGELVWYFQFLPHDIHDYDSTQVPVLLDAELGGTPRKLLLFPNRNGFYYVLDRVTGEFLVGTPFARQTWALGLDDTGRPIENAETIPSVDGALVYPDDDGAANWYSPTYSPQTNLIYQNVREKGGIYYLADATYEPGKIYGSPDIKVGRSPGRSDQELCDLGRNRLIHGFFWDLPEQYFLASVDGRLRRPRSGWGACSAAAKSRRKVFNLWLLLDDRWAGDTAQVEPVR